jgi:NAD+ synthase
MFSKRANVLVEWLRGRAEEAGAHGFVFGLSGGIDSAVVARLCQMATPNRVLGVILPCYSHVQDEADACVMAVRLMP